MSLEGRRDGGDGAARTVSVTDRRAAAGASLWGGWAGAPVLTSACGVRPPGGGPSGTRSYSLRS